METTQPRIPAIGRISHSLARRHASSRSVTPMILTESETDGPDPPVDPPLSMEPVEPLHAALPRLAAVAFSSSQAQDAAQHVLAELLRRRDRMASRPMREWVNYFRGAVRRAVHHFTGPEMPLIERPEDEAACDVAFPPSDIHAMQREAAGIVAIALAELPRRTQILLLRRDWLGHAIGEIARDEFREESQRARNRVSSGLRRARRALRRQLRKTAGPGAETLVVHADGRALALHLEVIARTIGLFSDANEKKPNKERHIPLRTAIDDQWEVPAP